MLQGQQLPFYRSQLQETGGNPQEQLHRISVENQQIDNMKLVSNRQQILNRYNSTNIPNCKIKINRHKQIIDISQWNSQTQTEIKKRINSKSHISRYNNHTTRSNLNQKDQRVVRSKPKQFQMKLDKSQDKHIRFLSMAQLCHRYTFVNQHGSHSQYFNYKLYNSSQKQKQQRIIPSPKHVQLKLKMPRDYYLQKVNKKASNFFNETNIKLPKIPIDKIDDTANLMNEKDILADSQCIKNVIKLMNKSSRKYLSPGALQKTSNKSRNSSNQKQQMYGYENNHPQLYQTKIGVGKKIFWKNKIVNESRINELKQKNKLFDSPQTQAKQEKNANFYIGPTFDKEQKQKDKNININKNRRKELFCHLNKNIDKYFGKKVIDKMQMRKLSKSLEECLILKKTKQK